MKQASHVRLIFYISKKMNEKLNLWLYIDENSKNLKSEESDESKHSISTSSQHEPIVANNEFVSDSYDHEAINEEEINKDLRQLNLNNNAKKGL